MRSAMSLIELVFTIVIMGIVVMSLPLILTQVQRNDAFAMQQEAILAAKAKIGNILTYEWDHNSYDLTASRSFVLTTVSPDTELDCNGTTFRRLGHVNADSRRKCSATGASASAIGADEGDGGNFTDIDDFNGLPPTTLVVTAGEDAGTLDYIFDLNLTTSINYAEDNATYSSNGTLNDFTFNPNNAPATPTNIKVISVTVSGGDQNITLRAFTCNIGESMLLPSRPYQ
ncbi:type II secretion system protein [Sulfurospirillum cavolei]|uniref:type II secretion system protein n=1 Tax=Sulfurospirillum cavolei TaxID=366522 RepID=UPI003FA27EE8